MQGGLMNPYTIVKINFLVLALFLVIFFMSKIDDGALKGGIEAMFGVPQSTQTLPASR